MMRADGVPPQNLFLASFEHFIKAQRGGGLLTTQGSGNAHLTALARIATQVRASAKAAPAALWGAALPGRKLSGPACFCCPPKPHFPLQNCLALRLVGDKLVCSAAAASKAEQDEQQQQGQQQGAEGEEDASSGPPLEVAPAAGAAPPSPPPFAVGWEYKVALASSTCMFYPVLALRSGGGTGSNSGK